MNRRSSLLAALLLCAAFGAIAQGSWPTRSITMIVPFPPGGLADLVARPVAEAMSRELGQPVVIENKAGAGGGIGMSLAAKSKPVDTLTVADLGLDASQVGWAGAGQQIVSIAEAPAREAGEVFEDDGTAAEKIVAFLDDLKVL